MTRYKVWLDQQGLQDLDPAIHIIDLQEQPPSQLLSTAARAQGDGVFLARRTRQSLSVTVRFAIREPRPARRQAILQKVRTWAQGSYLSTGDRPQQRLKVQAENLPTLSSALKWTDALSITFTAYEAPFWEDAQPTSATSTLYLPGDAPPAPLDMRWVCSSNAPAEVTIATPLSSITFRDLPLKAGQELVISHESGTLTATIDGADVLPHRTPESSDDLLLPCGQISTVTVTADSTTTSGCIFSARGRWL
ncbi:MAG: hypothetical protein IJX84_05345 [Clostridia bacterium]|nr:hypothetical protein [Clostridia bacterium]